MADGYRFIYSGMHVDRAYEYAQPKPIKHSGTTVVDVDSSPSTRYSICSNYQVPGTIVQNMVSGTLDDELVPRTT